MWIHIPIQTYFSATVSSGNRVTEKTNVIKQLDGHLGDSFSYWAWWSNGLSCSKSYEDDDLQRIRIPKKSLKKPY